MMISLTIDGVQYYDSSSAIEEAIQAKMDTLRSKLEAAETNFHDQGRIASSAVRKYGIMHTLCDELATALRKLQDGRTMRCDEPCGVIWCRWCYASATLARYDAQSAKEGK